MVPKPRAVRLRDGSDYLLRALSPEDAARLQAFFYTHTDETIYQRYSHSVRGMSHERALQLVSVDQEVDLGLGIFAHGPGGEEVICAVGRYYLDEGGRSAEVAFVVDETKRRIGMCRELLAVLRETARERGVERLWALAQATNTGILNLFRQAGANLTLQAGGSQVEVRLKTA